MIKNKEQTINDLIEELNENGITLVNIEDLNILSNMANKLADFIVLEFNDKNSDIEIGYEIAREKLKEMIIGKKCNCNNNIYFN